MYKTDVSPGLVKEIFSQYDNFAIIGLTGRVRSGQDDVVKILTTPEFSHLRYTSAHGGKYRNDTERENNVIYRFMQHSWRPFVRVHVSVVMLLFLLESFESDKLKVFRDNSRDNPDVPKPEKIMVFDRFDKSCHQVMENSKELYDNIVNKATEEFSANIYNMLTKKADRLDSNKDMFLCEMNAAMKSLLEELTKTGNYVANMKQFWTNSIMDNAPTAKALMDPKLTLFCFVIMPLVLVNFKNECKKNYIVEMQKIGNNLRAYGIPFPVDVCDISKGLSGRNIFCIAERVNGIIKIIRNTRFNKSRTKEGSQENDKTGTEKNDTFVLIDDFKNMYEVFYFRKRYSGLR